MNMNRQNFVRKKKEVHVIRPWVLLSGFVIGVVLLGLTCLLMVVFRPDSSQSLSPTAVVRVIPAPTMTPTISAQSPELSSSETTLSPGQNLEKGRHIRVVGTGGDGLRLRSSAGLAGEIKFLIKDGEELIIDDGPQEEDGYTWWHVQLLTDETVSGWGVSEYMEAIQTP